MTEKVRLQLLEKNQKIINMVVEKAKRDFPDDIALIGLSGSFSRGDYHEKSDLDLIIINNTPRGWDIAMCFILQDVGYDIYCTPCCNKIIESTDSESRSCAFHAACGAQNYLDEMTSMFGTKKHNFMQYFQANNIAGFQEAFLRIMDEYLQEYKAVGRNVDKFDTFAELYNAFMER